MVKKIEKLLKLCLYNEAYKIINKEGKLLEESGIMDEIIDNSTYINLRKIYEINSNLYFECLFRKPFEKLLDVTEEYPCLSIKEVTKIEHKLTYYVSK